MKIVVICGGTSSERDVSLITGDNVYKALKSKGHKVIKLDIFMGVGKEGDDVSDAFSHPDSYSQATGEITDKAKDIETIKAMREDKSACFFGPNVIKLCQMADVVFMALHGENGENGKVQAAFDLFGIKYTGSDYLSSAIAMNKNTTRQLLSAGGVPVAEGFMVVKGEKNDKKPSFPCVVKPCCGGSSVGVSIVNDLLEYDGALADAFAWENEVVVEQYIKGREFSIGVIEGKALPIIEIAPINGFYDYKNKYTAGSAIETCPAVLTDEQTTKMQSLAEKAAEIIGLDKYSRIDFLMNEAGEMYCLEANTLPGMTSTSLLPQEAAVIGLDFASLCEKLIEISLK